MNGTASEPERPPLESAFPGPGGGRYEQAVAAAAERVVESLDDGAYSGTDHDRLRERFADRCVLPDEGQSLSATLGDVADDVLADAVDVTDPWCVAHLQCPPALPALAAEVVIAATNQSMDSFDQAPAASLLEERVVESVASLFDFPDEADGAFTSGGTQSNFTGLLLARNRYCRERFDRDVQQAGLPATADRLRVLCSEGAHFTADQAAAHLGLGEDAVVPVATDDRGRLDPVALDAAIAELRARALQPFAVVGTAGTTDAGAIDPLDALADRAADHDLWFHVDAAYGGALALSERERPRLDGIARADSLAVDFHKLFYQPLSCGAFLLRDGAHYRLIDRNAAYLNPARDDDDGVPNLVGKSVQTSRRFDALKPYVTFRTLGRERLAEFVEYVVDLAAAAADEIRASDDLELLADPELSTVLFRYRTGEGGEARKDGETVATGIRDGLLNEGTAVVARTEVDGRAALKLTLLNPRTTLGDVRDLLDAVADHGERLTSEVAA